MSGSNFKEGVKNTPLSPVLYREKKPSGFRVNLIIFLDVKMIQADNQGNFSDRKSGGPEYILKCRPKMFCGKMLQKSCSEKVEIIY